MQRRHQKIIEETRLPSWTGCAPQGARPWVAAAGVGYQNAERSSSSSTETRQFFFLEMNTGLQVGTPVTMGNGLDLSVADRIAAGDG